MTRLTPGWVWALPLLPFGARWLESRLLPVSYGTITSDILLIALLGACAFALWRQAKQLEFLAVRDPLTGLYNRRKFDADLTREVERAHRLGTPLSLVYVDVDRFKQINDRLGHVEGDRVLHAVAQALAASVREATDGCYRIGGDEFAVILPGAETGEEFKARLESKRFHAPLSIGMVSLAPGETADRFLRRADAGMYAMKRRARAAAGDAEK